MQLLQLLLNWYPLNVNKGCLTEAEVTVDFLENILLVRTRSVLTAIWDSVSAWRSGGSHNSTANLCAIGQNDSCSEQAGGTTSDLYPFFMVGQVLLGVGAVPMFTVGLTYIDENTKPKMTSFYTGRASNYITHSHLMVWDWGGAAKKEIIMGT